MLEAGGNQFTALPPVDAHEEPVAELCSEHDAREPEKVGVGGWLGRLFGVLWWSCGCGRVRGVSK